MSNDGRDRLRPAGSERPGSRWYGSALRIGLLYLAFGAAWIVVTDAVLPGVVGGGKAWQTYKGLLFVLLSAALIYALVRRELAARRRAEERRLTVERRYRALFDRSVAGVFRTTPDGEILDANQALADLLGYDAPDQIIGTNAASYYVDPSERSEWVQAAAEEEVLRNVELHLRRRDGTDAWTLMNAVLLEDDEAGGRVLAGTMTDVTDEKRLRDELEAYAYHDFLTGLPNRRYLKEASEAVLSKARRENGVVALLYLDLNRFKRINDTLGHEAGDEVLFQVGRRLDRHLREEDLAARIGGDEFAVLLNTVDDEAGAVSAAQRLHDVLSDPLFVSNRSLHVDASIGIALYPEHGHSFSELLSRADEAMYESFEQRGTVKVYRPSGRHVRRDELAEEEDLRTALREGQFELHYQPIFRVEDGAVVGAEALARWRHPRLGLRRPGAFIPVAEHSGLILDLDLWVLETALEDARRMAGNGGPVWLSANVSAQSLGNEDALGRLHDALEASELGEGRFVLEVTESTAMHDPRGSAHIFHGLRDRGVRVAIDDFGTGHSALAYLKTLPVDLVKMDMIFVRGIEASDREERLCRAVLELGRALNVQVVAEGVEKEEQYRRLRKHGCHLAQGYYLGRPMTLAELGERIRERGSARS